MPHPTLALSIPRRRRLTLRATMLSAALLATLTACADRPPLKTRPSAAVLAPVSSTVAARPAPPAAVTEALMALLGPGEPKPVGDIALREIELGPSGPRALLAQGEGALCRDGNCPTGVFDGPASERRALLVVMAAEVPQVEPTTHLGRPDLRVTAIHSPRALMVWRYQWNGERYMAVRCSLVDRRDQAAEPCSGAPLADAPLVREAPAALCPALRAFVRQARRQEGTVAVMSGGFVIRDDAQAQVQGVRLTPSRDTASLRPVLACLRAEGLNFVRRPRLERQGTLSTRSWSVTEAQAGRQRLRFELALTDVPASRQSVLSLGAFLP